MVAWLVLCVRTANGVLLHTPTLPAPTDTSRCRDAAKIDRKRRSTLTSSRRVARACQSWLHGRRPRPCLRLPVRVFLSFDQETAAAGRSMALHPFALTELRSARTDFVTRCFMRASSVAARLIVSRPCISPSEKDCISRPYRSQLPTRGSRVGLSAAPERSLLNRPRIRPAASARRRASRSPSPTTCNPALQHA
jgi:hypothetical protein